GHRANILSRDATRVGVGVVFDAQAKELLVTQMFAKPPEKFDAHTVDELRAGVLAERRARKLKALERDAWLDELAQSTARQMADHGMSTAEAGRRIEAELQARSESWSAGHTVFGFRRATAEVVTSSKDSLADAGATHVAIGIQPGRSKDGQSGLFVVILLATRR